MYKHFTSIFLLLCAFTFPLKAQQSSLGLNPHSQKWRQINTDIVRVIYPVGQEAAAQRVVNLSHYLAERDKQTIGEKVEKLDIILQQNTTNANGFVGLAPFRSELFLTPSQFGFTGSGNWLDLLTIHEYRHVQQVSNVKVGLTKGLSYVFGENGWLLGKSLGVPAWFSEGDAVLTETLLTTAGRGRMPEFDMEYKSLLLSGKNYNYEKAVSGSFKDYVPNHYNLGYYLVTNARREFGEDIWGKVLYETGKYKGLVWPFSRSLKRNIGYSTPQYYRKTMDQLSNDWKREAPKMTVTSFNSEKKKTFTSYTQPNFSNEDVIITLKSGFNQIPAFYAVTANEEYFLTYPGFQASTNNSFSYRKGYLVWSEQRYDLRWGQKDYSVVMLYDVGQKKKVQLTKETKLFAPDLNASASQIVAAEANEQMQYTLVILDTNGQEIKRIPNPENVFFSTPRWIDETNVIVVGQKDQKMSLLKVDTELGTMENITSWDVAHLSNPYPSEGYVYYSSSYTGVNNIFAVSLSDKEIYQLTDDALGAFYPTVSKSGSKLAYSNFTVDGYNLQMNPIEKDSWKKYQSNQPSTLDFYRPLLAQETNVLDSIPSNEYESKNFRKTTSLINPHSLELFGSPPYYTASILLDNTFTTFSGEVGYLFNSNEREGGFYGTLTYGEWFILPQLSGQMNMDRSRTEAFVAYSQSNLPENPAVAVLQSREWEQDQIGLGFVMPLNLTKGNYFSNLTLSASYDQIFLNYPTDILSDRPFEDENIGSIDFELDWYRQQRRALQHIYPRWGQSLSLSYQKALNGDVNSYQFKADAKFFFPAFMKTHNLTLDLNYMNEPFVGQYKYSDTFRYARGYGAQLFDQIGRAGLTYTLPVWYPDIAISSLAFIKRIYLNGFFDMMYNQLDPIRVSDIGVDVRHGRNDPSNGGSEQSLNNATIDFSSTEHLRKSVGADVIFDFKAFRLVDMQVGFRYSYLLDNGPLLNPADGKGSKFDLLLNVLSF
ncbi:TolB-like translocation protein [Sediminitomix flava]|uniref:WD40 repeat protein n=1 Tax=Sediminitomix flava TaxID=379075 RepID=A0A315Z7S8_SEDFL|nr:hypothetical protein [Sediminitomix flava]PWJ40907.1 hypothetical protein BC781_104173 [Sediminitomix flava]